jgi:transposase InsO family protein
VSYRLLLLELANEVGECAGWDATQAADLDGAQSTGANQLEHGGATDRQRSKHLRMDNGPELIAWALRDWCRLNGTGTVYIEPGSPWENPYVESFNGRVRDELLNVEEFGSLTEAQVLVEAWRTEYNNYRPHSALDGLTPAEYAGQWTTQQQPALS